MNRSNNTINRFWAKLIFICVAVLFCACMESQEKRLERLIASGDQAFSQQQYKEAVDRWQEAMGLSPKNARIAEKLGHACLRLARFQDAQRYFRESVKLKPDAWPAWIEIGKLSVLSLDLQGGEEVWQLLKANGIRNPYALIYHGDLAMLQNKFNEAELDYRQALAIDPAPTDAMIKLAISLQVQEKDADAEAVINRLVIREIKDPLVLIQMGHFWNLGDDFQKAEKYMKKALDLDPADLRLQIRVANFYTAAGHYHEAAMILEPVLKDASLTISKEYANLLIQQEKIHDALAFLKPLLTDHPNDDTLKLMVGKCHLLTGNAVIAASEINVVAEKNPDSPTVHYLLGIAYLAGGYNQMGMQHLITALTLDNTFSDAELALAACYYKTREYALARQHAQRFIENKPGDFRPHMIVGAAYMGEGDYLQAKRAFAVAARLNPDTIAPLYFNALIDETTGRTGQAEAQYERLLAAHPMRIDIAEQYKTLLINSEQKDAARRFFENMAAEHPDNAYTLTMLGELYVSIEEPGLAMKAFKRVIEIDPGLTFASLQMAHLYETDDDLAAAVETLKNAIAVNPDFSEGMRRLAQLYLAGGDTPNAVAVLESAYAMNRDDPVIINNLATLYLEDDAKLIQAFELAQKAYEKNNTDPACIDTLGWAYYKKGLYRQAVWYLKEAGKKMAEEEIGKADAGDGSLSAADREKVSTINFHLGMALIKSGKAKPGAIKLKRAIELGLDGTMRETAEMAMVDGGEG
jgi:cellulose synthase operon protein C